MRMPQNASERISDTVAIDFQTQFAIWAHEHSLTTAEGESKPNLSWKLSAAGETLRQLLWLAGVELVIPDNRVPALIVRRLRLDNIEDIPLYAEPFTPIPGKKGQSAIAQLKGIDNNVFYFVELSRSVPKRPTKERAKSAGAEQQLRSRRRRRGGLEFLPWEEIRWLPFLSLQALDLNSDRDDSDWSFAPGEYLSQLLNKLCKKAIDAEDKKRLRKAVFQVVREATRLAVGTNNDSGKKSFMRRQVQGRRVDRSLRRHRADWPTI